MTGLNLISGPRCGVELEIGKSPSGIIEGVSTSMESCGLWRVPWISKLSGVRRSCPVGDITSSFSEYDEDGVIFVIDNAASASELV